MKKIAILNQKGGVGKTSLTCHLSGALTEMGLRVLAVDQDPQASLTQGRVGPDAARGIEPERTTWAIASGLRPDPASLILTAEDKANRWHLIPGSAATAECNAALSRPRPERCPHCGESIEAHEPMEEAGRLRHTLAEVEEEGAYDYCLIDCPPNLQMLSAQALQAADALLIPIQPEDYGSQGIGPVMDFYRAMRLRNDGLRCAGIVINMRQRIALHSVYVANARESHPGAVFESEIKLAAPYKEAIAARKSIVTYRKKSAQARAIRELAAELIQRVIGGAA